MREISRERIFYKNILCTVWGKGPYAMYILLLLMNTSLADLQNQQLMQNIYQQAEKALIRLDTVAAVGIYCSHVG